MDARSRGRGPDDAARARHRPGRLLAARTRLPHRADLVARRPARGRLAPLQPPVSGGGAAGEPPARRPCDRARREAGHHASPARARVGDGQGRGHRPDPWNEEPAAAGGERVSGRREPFNTGHRGARQRHLARRGARRPVPRADDGAAQQPKNGVSLLGALADGAGAPSARAGDCWRPARHRPGGTSYRRIGGARLSNGRGGDLCIVGDATRSARLQLSTSTGSVVCRTPIRAKRGSRRRAADARRFAGSPAIFSDYTRQIGLSVAMLLEIL